MKIKKKDFSLLFLRMKYSTCNVEVHFSFAQFFLLYVRAHFLSYYRGVNAFLFVVCVCVCVGYVSHVSGLWP